jgi:hypothetical protein
MAAVMHGITQAFFTIDFCLRFIVWPSRNTMRGVKTFLTNGNNVFDLISLMPFYLPPFISLRDNRDVKSLVVLRIIRIFRITRIFRIVRHSSRLQFIFEFLLCNNIMDVLVLSDLFLVVLIVFNSLIFRWRLGRAPGHLLHSLSHVVGGCHCDWYRLRGCRPDICSRVSGKLLLVSRSWLGWSSWHFRWPLSLTSLRMYMKSKGIFMWSGIDQGSNSRQVQQRTHSH